MFVKGFHYTAGHFVLWSKCWVFAREVVLFTTFFLSHCYTSSDKIRDLEKELPRTWLYSVGLIVFQDVRKCTKLNSIGQLCPPTFFPHFLSCLTFKRRKGNRVRRQRNRAAVLARLGIMRHQLGAPHGYSTPLEGWGEELRSRRDMGTWESQGRPWLPVGGSELEKETHKSWVGHHENGSLQRLWGEQKWELALMATSCRKDGMSGKQNEAVSSEEHW